ncbi:uncharacterized protein LY89DRAFT_761314 [Mollisia scopiformis]|uniref:Uncharacterized protein n=1 Tax=Mollisia scopiformis TaxID=149040 RepID=A0A132BB91_MOLSC|nr:uncharacterized protein LY89DRAFT_761314 [Mollisia scopiformis]KUJ09690.1 hypothetical protein LY89DRAFT_761314 [Mollisia scopiformis]
MTTHTSLLGSGYREYLQEASPSILRSDRAVPVHNLESEPKNRVQSTEKKDAGAKWTIGWRTPIVMVSCYVLALLLSITHLVMFIFLDNKPIISYHQSYVTTASTNLASSFRLTLKVALGVAFTQTLWRLLRKSSQTLRNVEDLFTMRTNPFLAVRWGILRSAPLLSLFVLVLWALEIVTNFPPGALTVTLKPYGTTAWRTVMALDTSYIGRVVDNSSDPQLDPSIAILDVLSVTDDDNSIITGIELEIINSNQNVSDDIWDRRDSVHRLASRTMISGTISTIPSPCGLNCTYSLQFFGPYMICDPPKKETGCMGTGFSTAPYYFGIWSNPIDDITIPYTEQMTPVYRRSEPLSVASFNTSVYTPLGWMGPAEDNVGDICYEELSLRCQPGQAAYNVSVTYQDGVQGFKVDITPPSIRVLTDLTKPTNISCPSGCNCCMFMQCSCRPLSDTNIQWISDANNMALIESMTLALAGQYDVQLINPGGADFNYTLDDGTVVDLQPISTKDESFGTVYAPSTCGNACDPGTQTTGPLNGTIVANTALNQRVNDYTSSLGPNITINQDILNEMLQNITLSVMNTLGYWTTEVNATTSTLRNVYSFSNKLNLILPYYLSLAVSLPLLLIGSILLHRNGVSATDGGFLQILTTTSTSKALHGAASQGALGGAENVPDQLKELKVRYGELIDDDSELKALRRRVGFGVEHEVVPIQKGARYGGV